MALFNEETTKYQYYIDACNKCAQYCYACFHACFNESDVQSRKNCINILIECAMVCQISVSMLALRGQFAKEQCELCAKICNQCAEECNKFHDEYCKECAQECKNCANECLKMATM